MNCRKFLSLLISLLIVAQGVMSFIPNAKANYEPYEKTFIITAYYSPLPGQSFYVTGSLARDKRLNGNGTHGADRTPVYSGMIAAPSTYAFGTRINCPGIVSGEVHDRGGAIVKAGVRTNAYDRLDIWAGHGELGLKKALYWGKRTVTCKVSPPSNVAIDQYETLPFRDFKLVANQPRRKSAAPTAPSIPAAYREKLEDLGYDGSDRANWIAFQIRHDIIDSTEHKAAGVVGPATRKMLDGIFAGGAKRVVAEGLEEGQVSPAVRQLQEHLIGLGYLTEKSTAIFGPKTKQALISFQKDQGLIESSNEEAAGYVGPGTVKAFATSWMLEDQINAEDRELITALNHDKIVAESLVRANELAEDQPGQLEEIDPEADAFRAALEQLSQQWIQEHEGNDHDVSAKGAQFQLASAEQENPLQEKLELVREKLTPLFNPFQNYLYMGSKKDDVRKLQTLLKEHGYFEGQDVTNYFGYQTRAAVVAFQVDKGVVKSAHSPGAGHVGPQTVRALNALHYQTEYSLPQEMTNVIRAPAIHPRDLAPSEPLQQARAEDKAV